MVDLYCVNLARLELCLSELFCLQFKGYLEHTKKYFTQDLKAQEINLGHSVLLHSMFVVSYLLTLVGMGQKPLQFPWDLLHRSDSLTPRPDVCLAL